MISVAVIQTPALVSGPGRSHRTIQTRQGCFGLNQTGVILSGLYDPILTLQQTPPTPSVKIPFVFTICVIRIDKRSVVQGLLNESCTFTPKRRDLVLNTAHPPPFSLPPPAQYNRLKFKQFNQINIKSERDRKGFSLIPLPYLSLSLPLKECQMAFRTLSETQESMPNPSENLACHPGCRRPFRFGLPGRSPPANIRLYRFSRSEGGRAENREYRGRSVSALFPGVSEYLQSRRNYYPMIPGRYDRLIRKVYIIYIIGRKIFPFDSKGFRYLLSFTAGHRCPDFTWRRRPSSNVVAWVFGFAGPIFNFWSISRYRPKLGRNQPRPYYPVDTSLPGDFTF